MALTITDIDYDSILLNFRNYLKSQETFKDYNFDGSAISELLKLLSYNTFYNAFYINHVGNEMYLDSAAERSSVVSRAKSLGYVPSSTTSAHIYVDLEAHITKNDGETIPPNNTIELLPYSTFSTAINEVDYNFITRYLNSLEYESDGGEYWIYTKKNVRLIEGTPARYIFKVSDEYETYTIPSDKIDVSSLVVKIYPSETSYTYTTYTQAETILNGVDGSSEIYWAYEGSDGKYYIQFGNGILGKKLDLGNIIVVEYVMSNGALGNGAQLIDVGNYYYSNTSLLETDALTVTPSNYAFLGIRDWSDEFTKDVLVRGETSNTTAYVYSHDTLNDILKLYALDGDFIFNEKIQEEYSVGANTVIGSEAYITSSKVETSMSTGGGDKESIEDIKFMAPKYFSAQNRLVTASDYEAIVKLNYPSLKAVSCWGGEVLNPPQLGNVYISVKPKARESLDSWEKEYILENIIEDKKMISMNVQIVDPEYVYLYFEINAKYWADAASTITDETIAVDIKTTLARLDAYQYNDYNKDFYFSAFSTEIDDSNEFILGNDTKVWMLRDFEPVLNVPYTANNYTTIEFFNAFNPSADEITSYSTVFSVNVGSTIFDECTFSMSEIDSSILNISNSSAVVVDGAGTIDVSNGIIIINNATFTSTREVDSSNNSIIKLFANPLYDDIESSRNCILSISPDSIITTTRIRAKR